MISPLSLVVNRTKPHDRYSPANPAKNFRSRRVFSTAKLIL